MKQAVQKQAVNQFHSCHRAAPVLLLALLYLLLAAHARNPVSHSAPPNLHNRIAFINPQGQLVTISPDGKNRRTLTSPGLRYQFPAWSPVADRLAVIGADPGGSGVFTVADQAGAQPTKLYYNLYQGPIYAYWSPDGKKLAFLANTVGGLGLNVLLGLETGTEADTGAGAGGAERRQLATGNPLYWQWSRDSTRLLVHRGSGASGEVAFYSISGEVGALLARPGRFNAPGVSASGRYLAYAEADGNATKVTVRGRGKADTETEVRYQGVAAFSWSPVGDKLALMSSSATAPHPYGSIRILDAQTGKLWPLVARLAVAFFWSPDGRYLAYLTPFRRSNEQFAERDGRVYRQVQHGSLVLELRVVEVATGQSRLLTAFVPASRFIEQFLPFFDQYALSHELWSPTSDALVLPMQGRDGPRVVMVPLEGKARVIAEGGMPFWSRR